MYSISLTRRALCTQKIPCDRYAYISKIRDFYPLRRDFDKNNSWAIIRQLPLRLLQGVIYGFSAKFGSFDLALRIPAHDKSVPIDYLNVVIAPLSTTRD